MTEKELREIKRRFRPEKSNIPRIVGCFVNENKEIIARISSTAMQIAVIFKNFVRCGRDNFLNKK